MINKNPIVDCKKQLNKIISGLDFMQLIVKVKKNNYHHQFIKYNHKLINYRKTQFLNISLCKSNIKINTT
jgi:hypothetical protein